MSLENFEFSGNKFDKNLKDNLKINNELVELAYQIVNWFLIKLNCLYQIFDHSIQLISNFIRIHSFKL